MMADEFVQAIKNLWTDDNVEDKGEFYNTPKSIIGPKPVETKDSILPWKI
jgi:alkanesulfonate monooxygenase SsuD/methylene tetrahydromethanopterin reductase-like flavin-dependent oxidoreductase (luciferase family)